jgi:serine/threonine protein kinase
VLEALRAFRPLVDAVAHLHKAGVVHRDIKPDNVFISAKGALVLGDCGLAIKLDNADRVTDTYENVGTRDWMPGWAHGMRLEDVRPNFDVFSLGKLLWALVAGRPKLRLWYHSKPEFDIRTQFPKNELMPWVTAILEETVVEEPEACIADATTLLERVDAAIEGLTSRYRLVNGDLLRKCVICGIGRYTKIVDHNQGQQANFGLNVVSEPKFRVFACDACGHAQLFYSIDGIRPHAWKADSR